MELQNFGSILSFAAELEVHDEAFYQEAVQNPACPLCKERFETLAKEHKQNAQRILRIRRENVTKMILEPIKDFPDTPYRIECPGANRMDLKAILETARKLEIRSEKFYEEAAEKIKSLPEVTGELRRIGKKHAIHREKLAGF